MDNNTSHNNNYDSLSDGQDLNTSLLDRTSVSSTHYFYGDKTQVANSEEVYSPSSEVLKKYNELHDQLCSFNKDFDRDDWLTLLNPKYIISDKFDEALKDAKLWFDSDINTLKESNEKELKDKIEEKKYWEERIENDKKHLDSLQIAKKETDFSKLVGASKNEIEPLFDTLTDNFRELTKMTDDKKGMQGIYYRVLSYIRNKPLDEKDVCEYCMETDKAYHYIKKQFAKEDKWINILDDQILVSKLRTADKHKSLILGDAIYKGVVENAEKLHRLCFIFGHLLVFSTDESEKVYKSVEYNGKVIDLDIFEGKPLPQKPNQKN
ncbi:hypothetical protein K501DRAFT_338261 [Backusella circina FSU 941]|nr:hypothetical protein K501DRAFT_338261 [Backusella circina FSU 941]